MAIYSNTRHDQWHGVTYNTWLKTYTQLHQQLRSLEPLQQSQQPLIQKQGRQFDVVNAFANAILPTLIACQCAEGYKHPRFVLQVQRALYRLKISLVLWYKEFMYTLEDLGLDSIPRINCLFINNQLIFILYVDDILTVYAPKHQSQMDKLESNLPNKYKVRQLREAKHFLGIRIICDRPKRKLWLIQDSYIDKIAKNKIIKIKIKKRQGIFGIL